MDDWNPEDEMPRCKATEFPRNAVEEAISELADQFEYGALRAATDPVEFLRDVTQEIVRLRKSSTEHADEKAELRQLLSRFVDHAFLQGHDLSTEELERAALLTGRMTGRTSLRKDEDDGA